MNKTKIKIKLKSDIQSKLAFVKIIKDYTGWGLKESKDFTDDLCSNFKNRIDKFSELPLDSDQLGEEFIKNIRDIGVEAYVTSGVQWNRNYKMISIGLGEKEDYVEFLSNYIRCLPYSDSEVLDLVLSKLDKDELDEIFNTIKIYDSSL